MDVKRTKRSSFTIYWRTKCWFSMYRVLNSVLMFLYQLYLTSSFNFQHFNPDFITWTDSIKAAVIWPIVLDILPLWQIHSPKGFKHLPFNKKISKFIKLMFFSALKPCQFCHDCVILRRWKCKVIVKKGRCWLWLLLFADIFSFLHESSVFTVHSLWRPYHVLPVSLY